MEKIKITKRLCFIDHGLKSLKYLPLTAELIELNLHSNEITNLNRINLSVNLQYLDLSSNMIEDISLLISLVNLTHINLSCNNIKIIPKLINFFKLTFLDLSYNEIKSFHNLKVLDQVAGYSLKTLMIQGNDLPSLPHIIDSIHSTGIKCLKVFDNDLDLSQSLDDGNIANISASDTNVDVESSQLDVWRKSLFSSVLTLETIDGVEKKIYANDSPKLLFESNINDTPININDLKLNKMTKNQKSKIQPTQKSLMINRIYDQKLNLNLNNKLKKIQNKTPNCSQGLVKKVLNNTNQNDFGVTLQLSSDSIVDASNRALAVSTSSNLNEKNIDNIPLDYDSNSVLNKNLGEFNSTESKIEIKNLNMMDNNNLKKDYIENVFGREFVHTNTIYSMLRHKPRKCSKSRFRRKNLPKFRLIYNKNIKHKSVTFSDDVEKRNDLKESYLSILKNLNSEKSERLKSELAIKKLISQYQGEIKKNSTLLQIINCLKSALKKFNDDYIINKESLNANISSKITLENQLATSQIELTELRASHKEMLKSKQDLISNLQRERLITEEKLRLKIKQLFAKLKALENSESSLKEKLFLAKKKKVPTETLR